MNITTNSARVESGRTIAGDQAFMDISRCCGGYGADVFMRHCCNGAFYIMQKKGHEGHGVHLVALPSAGWLQDLVDEGDWTVIQKIETGNNP